MKGGFFMKKLGISFLICLIIVLSVLALALPKEQVNTEYLRIHIRADSNEQEAQAVKYAVKDAVVEYLTPIIAQIQTKEQAKQRLNSELENIESVANATLESRGFSYTCSASIKTEEFPTRVYDSLTLEQGFYEALILELGSGKGDNWWCVVYPPLCFVGESTPYVYKSKIQQVINDFLKNKQEEK